MYNQDLIFRLWKTSFKYIQNQGWGKPSVRAGVLIFLLERQSLGLRSGMIGGEGSFCRFPRLRRGERRNLREMLSFKLSRWNPPAPPPACLLRKEELERKETRVGSSTFGEFCRVSCPA